MKPPLSYHSITVGARSYATEEAWETNQFEYKTQDPINTKGNEGDDFI